MWINSIYDGPAVTTSPCVRRGIPCRETVVPETGFADSVTRYDEQTFSAENIMVEGPIVTGSVADVLQNHEQRLQTLEAE